MSLNLQLNSSVKRKHDRLNWGLPCSEVAHMNVVVCCWLNWLLYNVSVMLSQGMNSQFLVRLGVHVCVCVRASHSFHPLANSGSTGETKTAECVRRDGGNIELGSPRQRSKARSS